MTVVDLSIFEKADGDDIERHIADLPKEQVVAALQLVTALRKALGTGEKFLVSRIEAEAILSAGEVWTAPTGDEFMWTGDRHRECKDGEGLRLALAPIVNESASLLAIRAWKDAFKTDTKVYLTELDKIVRFVPDAEATVKDFVAWKEGPKKLRPMDEEGK